MRWMGWCVLLLAVGVPAWAQSAICVLLVAAIAPRAAASGLDGLTLLKRRWRRFLAGG